MDNLFSGIRFDEESDGSSSSQGEDLIIQSMELDHEMPLRKRSENRRPDAGSSKKENSSHKTEKQQKQHRRPTSRNKSPIELAPKFSFRLSSSSSPSQPAEVFLIDDNSPIASPPSRPVASSSAIGGGNNNSRKNAGSDISSLEFIAGSPRARKQKDLKTPSSKPAFASSAKPSKTKKTEKRSLEADAKAEAAEDDDDLIVISDFDEDDVAYRKKKHRSPAKSKKKKQKHVDEEGEWPYLEELDSFDESEDISSFLGQPSGTYIPWSEKYAPKTEADLLVNKQKIKEFRKWMEEAFGSFPAFAFPNCIINIRINNNAFFTNPDPNKQVDTLFLIGPSGSCKTTLIKTMLMDFELVYWSNDDFTGEWIEDRGKPTNKVDAAFSPIIPFVSRMKKFQEFLYRARSCPRIQLAARSNDSAARKKMRTVVVVEDLPVAKNIIEKKNRDGIVSKACECVKYGGLKQKPIIFCITLHDSPFINIANHLIPSTLLNAPNVKVIALNAPTENMIRKKLENIINSERREAGSKKIGKPRVARGSLHDFNVSGSLVASIAQECNGDLRNAINQLEFACSKRKSAASSKEIPASQLPGGSKLREKVVEKQSVTRDTYVDIHHAAARILYGKSMFGIKIRAPFPPGAP